MVQWLGLHASTAGGPGSIPGQGTKILQAQHGQKNTKQTNKQKKPKKPKQAKKKKTPRRSEASSQKSIRAKNSNALANGTTGRWKTVDQYHQHFEEHILEFHTWQN